MGCNISLILQEAATAKLAASEAATSAAHQVSVKSVCWRLQTDVLQKILCFFIFKHHLHQERRICCVVLYLPFTKLNLS